MSTTWGDMPAWAYNPTGSIIYETPVQSVAEDTNGNLLITWLERVASDPADLTVEYAFSTTDTTPTNWTTYTGPIGITFQYVRCRITIQNATSWLIDFNIRISQAGT